MAKSRAQINDLAGSQRALSQGNLAPNHYWNKQTNTIDKAATLEQMDPQFPQSEPGLDSIVVT